MQPSAAAHKVQRNADPNHYTKYLQPAVDVVDARSGSTTGGTCGASMGEWIRPVDGPMPSPYGPRGLICNGAGCSRTSTKESTSATRVAHRSKQHPAVR